MRFWFVVKTQLGNWRSPHVASDGNGEVTFEWWCDTRSLTFIIHPDKAEIVTHPPVGKKNAFSRLRTALAQIAKWEIYPEEST